VYPFLRTDLLRLMRKPLSAGLRKSFLRSALVGLVELHDRNIIHSGAYYYVYALIYRTYERR
jgi:predicted transcriptional regulator